MKRSQTENLRDMKATISGIRSASAAVEEIMPTINAALAILDADIANLSYSSPCLRSNSISDVCLDSSLSNSAREASGGGTYSISGVTTDLGICDLKIKSLTSKARIRSLVSTVVIILSLGLIIGVAINVFAIHSVHLGAILAASSIVVLILAMVNIFSNA